MALIYNCQVIHLFLLTQENYGSQGNTVPLENSKN